MRRFFGAHSNCSAEPGQTGPVADWQKPGFFAVTTRAEEYRTQARECAERAKLAPDPETKRQYEDMARQWLELAKRAEKWG